MKILLSYIHYPLSVGRFFKAGFRRLGHDVISVGPYYPGYIPWQPNTDFSAWSDPPEIIVAPPAHDSYRYPLDTVLQMAKADYGEYPDAIVMVDAGFHLYGGCPKIPSALIATDPHCLDYSIQAKYVNVFHVMQHCYMQPYEKDAGKTNYNPPPQWLPYAYDPDVHFWMPNESITHDVTFIGVLYPERQALIARMLDAGINVAFYQGVLLTEGTRIYNQGKIAWCLSSRDDLPMRFWEGLAYHQCVIINRVPDLQMLEYSNCVEGEHYAAFDRDDPDSMIDLIQSLLADDGRRLRMADAGYVWVQQHTYDARCEQVLLSLGFSKKEANPNVYEQ